MGTDRVITGFPWVLVHPDQHAKATALNTITVDFAFKGEAKRPLVPMFTSSAKANALKQALGPRFSGLKPYQFADFLEAESLLEELKNTGVTYVQFNSMPIGHPAPDPIPIADVLGSLRHRFPVDG